MALHVKNAGSWVAPASVHVKHAGAWAAVQKVFVRVGGVWTQVWTAFIGMTGATVAPSTATGSGVQGIRCYTTSVTAAPTPSNASGPITYAWELVSGSSFTVDSSSAATTTFSYIPTTAVGARSGVYRCKVMQGATAYYTSNVSITIDWG